MDERLQKTRRSYHQSPTLEVLQRLLVLKSKVGPHQPRSGCSLKESLTYDVEWCELEHNNDPWARNLYIDASFEEVASVLQEFCGWSLFSVDHTANHLVYLKRDKETIFIRNTTLTEAVRFFHNRMGGQLYQEMLEAARGKTISVIYGCFSSRVS